MFLSRIEFNTRLRNTARALSSPEVLHAAVENCFAGDSGAERKLWRIDHLHDKVYLLLLSEEKPDFTLFAAQFCGRGRSGENKSYDTLLARLAVGQSWGFRLRANPVRSVLENADKTARGKVYGYVTIEQQKDWLHKRAPAYGFALDERSEYFDVTQSAFVRFKRQGKFVTLRVAAFEGLLRITDLELFTRALTKGIGRAKAYGCGLLTIMRPS